jgi:hypothetical protein
MVMACVYALLLWWHVRLNDERKKIVGCAHDHCEVVGLRHPRDGTVDMLTVRCKDCAWQTPLRPLLRMPPRGLFWFCEDHERWGPEHMQAIEDARRVARGEDEPPM